MEKITHKTAYYHLPGLFEFYELYRLFLPLYKEHREHFYDWCEIGSVYGAPAGCLWGGGRVNLGENCPDHICRAPGGSEGYRFSKAMENPGFIGIDDIRSTYLPLGFSNFKIEGRGLGSAMILEFLLYYMVKPEYHLRVREEIYLDSMLDLF